MNEIWVLYYVFRALDNFIGNTQSGCFSFVYCLKLLNSGLVLAETCRHNR
jgi:hypothetical protein